jgi:hypothetical protein
MQGLEEWGVTGEGEECENARGGVLGKTRHFNGAHALWEEEEEEEEVEGESQLIKVHKGG